MIVLCARCSAPASRAVPGPRRVEGDDLDTEYVFCPPGMVPALELGRPRVVCEACATDEEINRWVLSDAFQHGGLFIPDD